MGKRSLFSNKIANGLLAEVDNLADAIKLIMTTKETNIPKNNSILENKYLIREITKKVYNNKIKQNKTEQNILKNSMFKEKLKYVYI